MQTPQLPPVPRAINAAGRALARLGVRPFALEIEDLLWTARRQTGLDDYGDPRFREGLGILLDSLEETAQLSTLGRFIARQDLVQSLANRLQLQDWHARHPEIGAAPITEPIFIVGQGRTGTTILHELLALDPANRVPLTWEVDRPFPPPERATFETDPRIAVAQKQLDRSESLIPEFKRMHRMGAQLPQECVRITAGAFASFIHPATWRVDRYTQWVIDEADMAPVYAHHRRMLQLLQWRCPAERWVLKSPGHLWCLEAVLAAYPDARFVQTHRDPLRILSSLSSLEVVLRSMTSDAVVPRAVAAEWSRWLAIAYERAVDFREKSPIPEERIIDLQFREFIADPIEHVRRIYDRFGLELTPGFEDRMRAYLAANPSDRDGRHEHRFSDTGLDEAEERAKVKRYQEYFEVATERSG
jgi:hypothetical protein